MKKVLILGKGKSGAAVCDLLKKEGYVPVCVCDDDLVFSKEELFSFSFCTLSPGFAPDNRWIKACKEVGLKMVSELDLGLERLKSKNIVAVTGTNGKTTIVSLIAKMLESQKQTHLLGNVGTPLCEKVNEISQEDNVVLEVSSFMLNQSNRLHPKIAIISNITPDHIEWHKTHKNYVSSKLKILSLQTKEDYCIFAADDPNLNLYKKHAKGKVVLVSVCGECCGAYIKGDNIIYNDGNIHEVVAKRQDICMPGIHNQKNALMAIAAAKLFGISNQNITKTLREFNLLPCRIQSVATVRGTLFVNDSKSTNIDSTIKAIDAFSGKSIVLLLGGYDKGLDAKQFLCEASKKAKFLVFFGPAGKRFHAIAKKANLSNVCFGEKLSGAFNLATKIAKQGDVVLLSPSCSSFDEFSSYKERGKAFEQLVHKFEESAKTNKNSKP